MSDATYEGRMPTIDDFCDPKPNEQKEMFPEYPCFLFTPEELKQAQSRQPMKCICTQCDKVFFITKNQIQARIKADLHYAFCSRSCATKHAHKINGHNPVRTSYICQTCGKHVPLNEYYGTGKYCSSYCSHSAGSIAGHTKEARQKLSATLKSKYYDENGPIIYFQLSNEKTRLTLNLLSSLLQNWCIKDIVKLYKLNEKMLKKFILTNNIKEPQIFVSTKSHAVITACRHALNKPLELGSITMNDLETVKQECIRLMHEEKIPTASVCLDYLGMKSPNTSFLINCLHIPAPSIQEYGSRIREKYLPTKTDREKYYAECEFNFPDDLLPYTKSSHLIGQHPWYNPHFPKENGLTKDHMISKSYGYWHNIDSYLISHPANCEIMLKDINSSKNDSCSITVNELIERVEWWNENIIHKIFNDFQKPLPKYKQNLVGLERLERSKPRN